MIRFACAVFNPLSSRCPENSRTLQQGRHLRRRHFWFQRNPMEWIYRFCDCLLCEGFLFFPAWWFIAKFRVWKVGRLWLSSGQCQTWYGFEIPLKRFKRAAFSTAVLDLERSSEVTSEVLVWMDDICIVCIVDEFNGFIRPFVALSHWFMFFVHGDARFHDDPQQRGCDDTVSCTTLGLWDDWSTVL